ncbi:protein split ends [Drosophila madeirensis]|uniref:Enhancer of polycomb-like protein n=1 Tax=Drosophila madeirensis TaxID=30013 RepID=A0AAU9G9T2_DROMD
MSKLSFRARHLDPSKQMPIYLAEELPDLPEYSAINRAVPQMPSGMEKEEESEHHLQRAICTGLIIPTPEVLQTDQPFYDTYYPPDYKMPRQMIHMQPLGLDTEVPDYDMDKADMEWLNQQERLELSELKFEQLMDLLEKSSGQTVVTLNEAKSLLNQDDETSISLYDYWLNKRLKMQHPLILTVKTESRPGASSNNPYLAFRRRTEKMQTRKNRKNDEASYEKMLKLRRDLQRATTILEMVRRREETKREQLKTSVNIFEKRVEMRDFNGAVYSELNAQYKSTRPAYNSVYTNQYSQGAAAAVGTGGAILAALPPGLLSTGGAAGNANVYASPSQYLNTSTMDTIHSGSGNGSSSRKEKRPYKKRKHKLPRDKQQNLQHQQLQQQQQQQQQTQQYLPGQSSGSGASPAHHLPHHLHNRQQSASPAANDSILDSEEDDYLNGGLNGNQLGSESEDEAPFAFRRKPSCIYLPTRHRNGRWPYDSADEETETSKSAGGYSDPKYRYTLTSINYPRPRCIGFARRRVGRGGRILLDRAITNFDDVWSQLDYTVMESVVKNNNAQRRSNQLKPEGLLLPVAKPCSPPTVVDLVVVPAAKPMDVDETSSLPLDIVKSEPNSEQADKPIASNRPVGDSMLLPLPQDKEVDEVLELEPDGEEDDLATDDENVARLSFYSSAVTLSQNSHDMRLKRRRLRHKKQQMRELNAAKRLKRSSEAAAAAGEEDSTSTAQLCPLPRAYLQRLVLALGQKLKQEEPMEVCENLAPQEEKSSAAEELPAPRANHQQQHHHHHRSNNNNNTVLNNNNNSSSSSSSSNNMNKDVSISDKINVIKLEAEAEANESVGREDQPVASTSAAAAAARAVEAAAAAEAASSTSSAAGACMLGPSVEDVAKTIKRELIDADDSNEPLSSIRTATVLQASSAPDPDPELMDDEAEDDVNLAQLSNIIRHTAVKKELEAQQQQQQQLQQQEQRVCPQQELKEETVCLNQLPDVIRLQNLRNSQTHPKPRDLFIDAPAEELDVDYLGGLSPTSSQRLDICNELLSEIRRDWLHFRPKTPTDELSDSHDGVDKPCSEPSGLHAVDWTQDTPVSIELNRLGKLEEIESDSSSYFLSNAFKYTDMDSDAQLIQTAYAQDYARGNSKSPNCSGSGSGSGSALEFNLSAGDSLTDINNLLGDDEDDNHEHMLDNILQECAMDDPKALNQATSFWNGILDGEAAVDEVEIADQLLDCIDEKKPKVGGGESSKRAGRPRKPRPANVPVGSSSFTVCPTQESLKDREVFFSQEVLKPKEEPQPQAEPETASVPVTTVTTTTADTLLEAVKVEPVLEQPQPEVVVPSTVQLQPTPPPQSQSQSMPLPIVATPTPQLINIPAQITPQKPQMSQIQSQVTQLLNQFANAGPQIIARTEYGGGAAVGDIVTITPHTGSSPLPTLSAQQQLQHQLAQAQLRNVTVQQRQGTPQQVQVQQQQQQPTQQLLFQMQRDGIGSPVITTQSIVTSSRSLTPLNAAGAGAAGNHMIYTTGSGEIITAAAAAASQKVTYAIQKTSGGGGGATTTSIGPNTVITLSNVKLQSDDNCSAGGVGSSSGSSVNIINTASGQQLAVHSIAGMQQHQQQQQQQQQGSTTTPLIVTTPNRNNVVQQHSQQQLVQQQPIVWRQVSGTNTAVATTAVLSTTADTSPAAVGNKILWTSRATQKRQLNGPENTDINKLLLNRKFSQRKVIGQHPGGQQLQQQLQQQIQLTKQQLQQLVHHEDDMVTTTTTINSGDQMDTGESLPQQQHHQHQQLQKLSKVIKMSPFPLLVSDLNLQQQPQQQQQQQQQSGQHSGQSQQQQQQQQLKPNSAAAIAANHNYSLQPATAIISSQSAPQQANKIFLTSSNSGGGGNFTIATASELQAAAAAVAASNSGGQKLHYKELTNSNLKLNFVSSTGETLASQAPQQVGATTVVLNKAQQQQVHHQKLKAVSAANAQQVQQGDKRVLYTSLLNVKPLQKNNSGQMQMQLGPGGLQQVLRGRLNNSAIITRTLPLGTTVNSSGGGGAGGTPTTIRQLVSTNANNVGSSDGGALLSAKDVGKSLTVEQVIASANNGGVVMPTSNNNNNNGGGTGSGGSGAAGGGVSGGVTVTTSSNVNVTGAGGAGVTSTINR